MAETLPDTFAALNYLKHLYKIDSKKIGILGFSWRGLVSVLIRNAFKQYQFGCSHGLAANIVCYPVCWVDNKVPCYELENLANRPLLIPTRGSLMTMIYPRAVMSGVKAEMIRRKIMWR